MRMIDIIMPVYNSEKFLPETLNSIVTQTYPQWRLWVCNDGSTDRSYEIILNFAKTVGFDQIKVFSGPNQGVSAARNFLRKLILEDPRSDLIAFCDSDDKFWPMHLWDSVYHFDTNPETDFLYSDVDLIFIDGSKAFPNEGLKQPPFNPPIFISTVMFKKHCFSVGEFDGRLNGREDWMLWLKIRKAGYNFYYLNEILTTYIVRLDGVASTWNSEKEKLFNEEIKKLEK
jgi:glycosyltransferase involved in cell wall biosynthesis